MNQANDIPTLIELRALLQRLHSSEIHDLADLRRIEELRRNIEQRDDTAFFAIRATVSDLDAVPERSRRYLFSDAFLKQYDEVCAVYLRKAGDELRYSVAALLALSWLRADTDG